MGSKHYIGLGGDHGYMPDYSTGACDTLKAAVDALCALYGLGERRERRLRRDLTLELGWDIVTAAPFGAEYCEIQKCSCDTPEVHGD